MKNIQRFMIVDDDPLNNSLCKFLVGKVVTNIEIKDFLLPIEGLNYIQTIYNSSNSNCPTILLLDINMPILTGWDFLDEFAKMGKHIHQQFIIYIVSSSIDFSDIEKANANIFVKEYVTKPLSLSIIKEMVAC